ncbi:MAG: hypothetical protein NTV46_05415 [Verrucomicrobia bacterium]|nr:hypothetical protein [Verrucomicrobiota bacterium]
MGALHVIAFLSPERLESVREKDKVKQQGRRKLKGEIINAQRKDAYQENRNKVIERNNAWRSANWDAVAKQRSVSGYNRRSQNKWYHNKGKYDLQFVISERLRGRLRRALRNGRNSNATKFVSALDLVGCSPEHLIDHLQSQFQIGMTWENYGEWHIDHIRPCNSFDLQCADEQRACFHYTNLQPLWGRENILKGDKLLTDTEQDGGGNALEPPSHPSTAFPKSRATP